MLAGVKQIHTYLNTIQFAVPVVPVAGPAKYSYRHSSGYTAYELAQFMISPVGKYSSD